MMHYKKTLILSLLILLAGVVVMWIIFSTEPKAERGGATKQTAMLVDTIGIVRDTYRPSITVMGNVQPSQDIVLSPSVSGEIIRRSASFTPGGFVRKGEILLQIDPADYSNVLQQRKSALRQAVADLNIEMGRQEVAEKDYQLLDETLSKEQEKLILRKPQLNAARSRVESARAAVEQAELDLQRTTIRAPFDAHILSRQVNLGSQVAPGDHLGRLVGIENYWVEASVPLSQVPWIKFPETEKEKGSKARIRNQSAWSKGTYRTGYLYKLVGILEDQTRMARVLINVPDPLVRKTDSVDIPSLIIGSFVEANIRGKKIKNVIRLNRDYIRKDETVWTMEEGKLRIKKVQIKFRDKTYAYIAEGLTKKDKVVITNLTTIVEGARLRLASDASAGSDSLVLRNNYE